MRTKPNSVGRRGPELWDTWQRRSPHYQGGEVRSRRACGGAWMHALLLALTSSLYVGVLGLQGTDSGSWAHHGRGYEPAGGANFSAPHLVILNFLFGS
jgi:hypothetical protein